MARARKVSPATKADSKILDQADSHSTTLSFPDMLIQLDGKLLELAEQRIALLQQWRTASQTDGKVASPPPAIWEQLELSSNELQRRAPDHGLTNLLGSELLRAMIGVTQYSVEPPTPVAYLGPKYSYSYLAASRYFTESARLSPVSTIAAVFDEIVRSQAEFGVVPIENSTDGRIVDTLTMFAQIPMRICGEVLFPIHHCLLGRCEREEIREVYSKPQALSQCRRWLSQHLPDARLIEIGSTTAAAQLAVEKPATAAIASEEAGRHYGLNLLQKNIEDNAHNLTRFAIIGYREPKPTGCDKTSIMFQIPHKSGALAKAMQTFSKAKLNMTWIESFPIPGNTNEYLFFIEFEGHQSDKAIHSAIAELGKQTLRLEILGSYPRGK